MRGFTLLELLVVISIMAILTIIAVPNFNKYSEDQKLNDAASQLQSVLRQAQNNAQTGTVCNVSSGISKATYWRVSLSKTSPANQFYSIGPFCETGLVTAQQIDLPEGVTIYDLNLDSCTLAAVQIRYNNINSEVSFFNLFCSDSVNAKLEIKLNSTGTALNKTVVVEKGGGIYVKQ